MVQQLPINGPVLTEVQAPDRPLPKRRLLVVAPNFAPVSAVDYQRIRTALPYLADLGWEAEILTVHPDHVEHRCDPHLAQTLPADLVIHRVAALPQGWTRRLGLGNLGWRALPFLAAAGDRLLQSQSFDLVLFSTTMFPTWLLGPRWKRRFSLPYLVDFQDPWRVDRQQRHRRAQQQPGGRLKYAIDKTLARWLEPQVVKQAAQILAVSPDYLTQLQCHYPDLPADRLHHLTFAAPTDDLAQLPSLGIRQGIFDPQDGKRHWVYVGRGGDDLLPAVELLLRAIAQDRQAHPDQWQSIQIHFVGTSYAPAALAQPSFLPLAEALGLGDCVSESPQRVPYFEALQLLADSDVILLFGSRDLSYSPSKIYPCLLTQKPLLALLPSGSPVRPLLHQAQPEAIVEIPSQPADLGHPSPQLQQRLRQLLQGQSPVTAQQQEALAPYLAETMTQELVALFERAIAPMPPRRS